MRTIKEIVDKHTEGNYLMGDLQKSQLVKELQEHTEHTNAIEPVVSQSEQYCECENPTLGKSISRCGTCDDWFKPLK